MLYAGSEPWADKLYYLRDTLTTRMSTANHTPEYYERVANEDGKYARDVVRFTRDGNRVTATTRRYRRARPGAELKQADAELEAIGETVDMVSAFYYARTMPFAKMAPGQQRIINIFSAKKKERLTITFAGTETVRIDNRSYDTYHIKFRFTTDGGRTRAGGTTDNDWVAHIINYYDHAMEYRILDYLKDQGYDVKK